MRDFQEFSMCSFNPSSDPHGATEGLSLISFDLLSIQAISSRVVHVHLALIQVTYACTVPKTALPRCLKMR